MMHTIAFHASGRGKAQCPPNPAYPNGIAVPAPRGAVDTCLVQLPYPAPECGFYCVECRGCGFAAVITVAGRADDPVSIALPCKIE
jgi:hypothetical protein